jgi:hypothetical protein
VGFDNNREKRFESVYSQKVKAGKRRTYFMDVRQTKGEEYYLTITERTRHLDDDGVSSHKIFVYKEDLNRFLHAVTDTINHIKTELMPDYDYDEFTRRYEEEEQQDSSYSESAPLHARSKDSEGEAW